MGAASPAELFAAGDIIMISMLHLQAGGNESFTARTESLNARPGTVVIIDLTSADASSTKKINADLEAKGIDMIDAPISGGQAGAINQTLTVMVVGGKRKSLKRSA